MEGIQTKDSQTAFEKYKRGRNKEGRAEVYKRNIVEKTKENPNRSHEFIRSRLLGEE